MLKFEFKPTSFKANGDYTVNGLDIPSYGQSDLKLTELNLAALDQMLDQTSSEITGEKRVLGLSNTEVSISTGLLLTTGFVTWALRGSAITSALLSSMPVWWGIDPIMPIISSARRRNDIDPGTEDISKVDQMFQRLSEYRREERKPQ